MDHLIAKIKGRGGNYAKLLTDKTTYDTIPDFLSVEHTTMIIS